MNNQVRIAVIGAGCSGITAVKNLLQAGLNNVVCFEKNNQLGGNWIYSPDLSHSSVFETTHIISSKKLSQFSDFPMPDDYPDYPSHQQLHQYFTNYATHFDVIKYIKFNTEVLEASLTKDKKWKLDLNNNNSEIFDYLLIANGHHWDPLLPKYKGNFTGQFIHSHQFKNNKPFTNKKILVIGGGNSACDCAVECSRVAQLTDISMRRGYYIVPKFMFWGQPADVLYEKMLQLPKWLRIKILSVAYKLMVGDMTNYGLQKPKHKILQAHPTLNSELLYMLRHGKVKARKDIARFNGNTVFFADNTQQNYDTIIACTGYKISFPFFKTNIIDFSKGAVPLYLHVFHPLYQNLFFIGLVQPMGCIWPLAEAQSKLVANTILQNYKLPVDMLRRIKKNIKNIRQSYQKTPRHYCEVDFHEYLKDVQQQISKINTT